MALHFDRLVEEVATTCRGKSRRSAPDQHLRALALDALQVLDALKRRDISLHMMALLHLAVVGALLH